MRRYIVEYAQRTWRLLTIGFIITVACYGAFNIYIRHTAKELLNAWVEDEAIAIQEGNLLSAISKNQRVLFSSNFVRGVSLFGVSNGRDETLMTFGDHIDPPIQGSLGCVEVNQSGLFRFVASYVVSQDPFMTVTFLVAPSSAPILFFVFVSGLFALISLFHFRALRFERHEASKRELLLRTALEDLSENAEPSPLVVACVPNLVHTWNDMCEKLRAAKVREIELVSKARIATLAKQIAHDIRSPLSALNMVLATSTSFPEEKRNLIRSAISRINDISNNLLFQNQPQKCQVGSHRSVAEKRSVHLLSSLIENIVSEKRLQYRNFLNVEIEFQPTIDSYGLFADVDAIEFKRMISNLINNSIEALSQKRGRITINLTADVKTIFLEVVDNGAGIAANLLALLGNEGVSFGKENTESAGSGLGLYHARKNVELWGGNLEIKSVQNGGTTVRLSFQRCEPPTWFVNQIELPSSCQVVIVDDDASIHRVWQDRIASLRQPEIEVIHFSSPEELLAWIGARSSVERRLYLMDYEFLGGKLTGLDTIKQLAIHRTSVLVTSHFEDDEVLNQVRILNSRMIPKSLAGLVPVIVREPFSYNNSSEADVI